MGKQIFTEKDFEECDQRIGTFYLVTYNRGDKNRIPIYPSSFKDITEFFQKIIYLLCGNRSTKPFTGLSLVGDTKVQCEFHEDSKSCASCIHHFNNCSITSRAFDLAHYDNITIGCTYERVTEYEPIFDSILPKIR